MELGHVGGGRVEYPDDSEGLPEMSSQLMVDENGGIHAYFRTSGCTVAAVEADPLDRRWCSACALDFFALFGTT